MAERDEKLLQFIEEVTRNADAVQKNVLAEILCQNAETEYLKRFNLDGATDYQTFKSKIPMMTYEDIQPLIQRIADGDRSPILTAQPISELLISSGTSGGERKLIPTTKQEMDRTLLFCSLFRPIMRKHVKELDKALQFRFTKAEKKTQAGLTAQSRTSSLYKRLASYEQQTRFTSPNEAVVCADAFQSMYTQMLCGLYDRQQVVRIGAAFAYSLVWAIKFLQLNWQQLTHDIRTGLLNPKVTDTSIRGYMNRLLRPDPDLADFIAQECGKDDWEGIITRIWPNTKYLDAVVTGTMAQYLPTLDFYSGGLPKVSMMYTASECFFAINLNPMCNPSEIVYTIMPNMAYFEFLPQEPDSSDQEELICLTEVEIGKEYEIVITTYAGLYRYQMGDILRVTGFHNSAPQFEFVRRKNVVLSIDMDKTNEVQLQTAVDNACRFLQEFKTCVVEYTSYADTKTFPGHYVIYWELMVKDLANSPSDEVLGQCCLAMEEMFDSMYRVSRVLNKTIGPLEIRVLKKGTFEEVMEYAISNGASVGQYKVPRCVNSKPIIDLLDSRVVSKHFSPSLPFWTLEPVLKE